jgi:hypothetical protein
MTEQNQQSVTGQFEETTGRPLSAGTSPQTISVNCGNIPEELQHHRSWVAWEFGTTDNEKVKKLPVNPQDGWTAKTNDPETWGTYDEAERFSELHELDGIQGIGFVFTKEDPLCGIDLDDCRNPETGEIEQWGRDILQDLNSYSEVSPSGKGIKIFTKASLPGSGRNFGKVEMYDSGRYFTVTGQRLEEYPAEIEERQEQVVRLYEKLAQGSNPTPANPGTDSDPEEIPEGTRNTTLTSIAGRLRAGGMGYEELYRQLLAINQERCRPALPDEEVERIARSVSQYEPNENEPGQRRSQAEHLIALAEPITFFHDADKECFAEVPVNGHKEVWSLKSNGFKDYLSKLYYDHHSSAPNSQALQNALGVFRGRALFGSREEKVHVRLAKADDAVYLDLCNDQWEYIRITSAGWEIIKEPPVHFRRPKGIKALPRPVTGGSLEDLRVLINEDMNDEWILLASWLIGSLNPNGSYPILIIHGEQGSAKSTTTKIIKSMIDPGSALLKTLSRSTRDLMITSKNCWVLSFDNLSGLKPDMSDAFCRLATGGGFSTRQLYDDSEEVIFDAKRPIILNGIDELATRQDLADRALLVNMPRIPEGKRKLEQKVWKKFKELHPRVLGALLDAVSYAMKHFDKVSLKSLPRMADFATWVIAAEPILPWPKGRFLELYNQNREEAALACFESDQVAIALREFIEQQKEWQGTATELLKALEELPEVDRYRKSWPKSASYLSGRVSRIADSLRKAGISVEHPKTRGVKKWKFSMNK